MKRIIAAAMVKNESDIIESFIRHAFTYIDGMVIYDDNSFDDTPGIIQSLAKEGYNLNILSGGMALGLFEQAPVTNRLIDIAIDDMGADIVIPMDADEFLIPSPGCQTGTVRDILLGQPYDDRSFFASCWTHFIPTVFARDNSVFLPKYCQKYYKYNSFPLRLYSNKVIFRRDIIKKTRCRVVKGNHSMICEDDDKSIVKVLIPELTMAHFPYRSREQLMVKVLTGIANRQAAMTGDTVGDEYKRAATSGYNTIYQELKKHGFLTTKQIQALTFATYINIDPDDKNIDIADNLLSYNWDDINITLKYTDYEKYKSSMWGIILTCYEDILAELNMEIRMLRAEKQKG